MLELASERRGRLAACLLVLFVGPLAAIVPGPGPAHAADQVSDDDSESGCGSFLPVTDGSGSVVAWQSDCDPAGTNADASIEIFRATVGGAASQLTSGTACSSTRPTISADGSRIAFESSCDLLPGGNADGNVEIFIWKNGTLSQITTTVACDNFAPSINGAGTFLAYDSNCITANNTDGSYEIFRVSHNGGTPTQLTKETSGTCDSTSASISGNGDLVAFDSDCDLTGQNEDFAVEIFTVTSAGVVTQRTAGLDDSCSSLRPSMDAAGSIIAFQSDCDFSGTNPDRGEEIFTVKSGELPHQVTSVSDGVTCANGEPRIASSGNALVFSSYCAFGTTNNDGSVEVFQVGVGSYEGGILAVTGDVGCSSVSGGIDASGSLVVFDSDCDPTGGNGDGSVEAYRSRACVCGAPATRKSPPKASDALYTLRSSVGTSSCAACECDTDSSGSVGAADALRILKKAVGQDIELTCP